ncbi:hypothetical protein [Streptomyces flavofungini]|uniref:hypothetical protein n=1 Tax=Streptomyces flavofungini TaxID=68200 RepID=UPI0025B27B38|nr:hypothetical protein [Streptomyces flavofungini]WJV49920.1 hypothetical protein QUY26_32985 [Streptomyces flavofungini]
MSEENENVPTPPSETAPPAPPAPPAPSAPPAPPAPPQPLTYAELLAERDSWQQKAADAQAAQASAVETAATAARQATMTELGPELLDAALRLKANAEGVELPNTEYLDIRKFTGEDGRPKAEAVEAYVTSLPKSRPEFPQLGGMQVTYEGGPSLSSMDPEALADHIAGNSII